jgi:hypothetical protein
MNKEERGQIVGVKVSFLFAEYQKYAPLFTLISTGDLVIR